MAATRPAERQSEAHCVVRRDQRHADGGGVDDLERAVAFYRDLALLPDDNPSRLRLGYVALDGNVLATFSGTLCHDRMGVMLSSLTEGEEQRQSPGGLLLRHQIEEACAAGVKFFDLGVGQVGDLGVREGRLGVVRSDGSLQQGKGAVLQRVRTPPGNFRSSR